MADKNASKENQPTSEKKDSSALMFKVLLAVIVVSVLTMILKSAGVF